MLAKLAVAGLIEGDSLVGQRIIDDDRHPVISCYRPVVFQHGQDAFELFWGTVWIMGNTELFTAHREAETYFLALRGT